MIKKAIFILLTVMMVALLLITFPAAAESEPNDSLDTAESIGEGTVVMISRSLSRRPTCPSAVAA